MTGDPLLDTMIRAAEGLTPGDIEHTLRQITATAARVLPGVDYANITIRHADGRLETVAPTDDLLLDVDAAQYEYQEGPCYDAATDAAYVAAPDLATDERFPRFAPVALSVGIKAQAGVNLFETPRSAARGALNLYSREVGTFSDMDMIAGLFAQQAALALDYARQIENLEKALQTRRRIGTAVGLVMERFDLNEQRAFGFLTRLSQDNNVKLRDVAERIVSEAEATR